MNIRHQSAKTSGWLLTLLLCLYCVGLGAAISTSISYQGYLTDSNSLPENGSKSAEFKFYTQPVGGSAVWTENHNFTVTNGLFQVELGSQAPFTPGLFDNPLYLGININDDGEMTPRLKLNSVPTAFLAEGLVACASGETNCDGTCADLNTDTNNCGSCNNACAVEESCVAGSCTTAVCGNGMIEPGEQCEGPGTGCCSSLCQFESASIVCRVSSGSCDITEFCSGFSEVCPGDTFAVSDTVCGSSSNTACTDPDTCDGNGVCNSNHANVGTFCSTGPGGDCYIQDTCDGSGSCADAGFQSSGTACGDGSNTVCSDPDTCNSTGTCQSNHAGSGTVCGEGVTCDGTGVCN